MRYDRYKKGKLFFVRHRREATIFLCALLVLLIVSFFPSRSVGEAFFLTLLLFFAFPALVIRFLLKEPSGNFGLSRGELKPGMVYAAALVAIFALIGYILVFQLGLKDNFALVRGLAENFWTFLFLETAVAIPLYFSYEFFFRGFVQMGLEKKLGGYSVVLAALLQTILFLKMSWIAAGLAFFSALSAGFIVRQSRSVTYSVIFSWIISLSLDIMLIRAIQQGLQ